MYEAVHAYPDGETTAARFAETAAACGYDGIVVRGREASPDYDALADGVAPDVVDAAEIVVDTPERASGAVGHRRRERTLLLLRGGTRRLNRFAVGQERIDVLTRPTAGDDDIDHVLVRTARDNGVRLEFDFGPVLRSDGGPRVRALKRLERLRRIVDHYDAPYVVSANPASHLELRAPRELRALGEVIGFEGDGIERGLREWGRLAARNRERRSESFIAPGVERGRYEKNDR